MTSSSARHISQETLEEYVARGAAATIPVSGEPEALLTIDPPNETLRLEIAWDGQAAPLIGDYVHISAAVHYRNGQNWSTLEVHGARHFPEAYPLLRSVADLVQEKGAAFSEAVKQSLYSYHRLLQANAAMAASDEVGLFGELLVVSHLIDLIGAAPALQAWRGGDDSEEHDLGLEQGDVEIKTTTSDRRRHWISSLTQLVPSLERRLWLLSIQLTGAGASEAMRLPQLIESIAERLEPEVRSQFEGRLARSRYRPSQPLETFRLLRLRTAPMVFLVDGSFPKIDPEVLQRGGAALRNITEVSYTVNLDGIAPATDYPAVLRSFVVGTESHEPA